jgi:hypothetical protein
MHDPALGLDNDECHELFAQLFPHGLHGGDVLAELAPDGWEASPLAAVAHPSPEQLYEESLNVHEGMKSFAAARAEATGAIPDAAESSLAAPSLEEIRRQHQPQPFDAPREVRELVGMCLWDIFSDNHEVTAADGRVVDLGSHRAAAGFLAQIVNRSLGIAPGAAEEQEMERLKRLIGLNLEDIGAMLQDMAAERAAGARIYDYMDFYMGARMVGRRADLGPVYRMIFRRLRKAGFDWRYSFPRLYLADLRPLRDALREQESDAAVEYDPSAALAAEQVEQARDAEIAETRAKLDEAYREAVEAARDAPPPATVAAYRGVYGEFPEGWPPEVE